MDAAKKARQEIYTDRETRLTEVERDGLPAVQPRDAATLILVDRSGPVPKVLLGRRHANLKFMPGKFVFPGGRVEPRDAAMPVARPLHAQDEKRLMTQIKRPSAQRARAIALAAIRETFEETGLLLGSRDGQNQKMPSTPGGPWEGFVQAGLYPDLSALRFVGRAVTPPGRPRRFDTRFFAADYTSVGHRIEGVTGPDAELVELVWLPLGEAQHLDMPQITTVMLEELESRIAAGFGHDLAVPYYRMIRRYFHRFEL
jgi:8-oxo-dGTP pyrophosphatase MutT (NUDIX family)